MERPDLNLLVALDVLLEHGSVVEAARRLRLSPSAMSRTLGRLRAATGDPILVRAGRKLALTPRGAELRLRVADLVREAETVLGPATEMGVAGLTRTFTLRVGDGFVETFGPALLRRVEREAPRARIQFLSKSTRDSAGLRDGSIDMETGVVGKSTGPEVRALALFKDRFVGVVRPKHPLARGRLTPERLAGEKHVDVAQHANGPVDSALHALGLAREIAVVVGGFSTALALARASDLVACVPERHTEGARAGMRTFALPVTIPPMTLSLLWHPRFDADAAHKWMRRCVRETCAEAATLAARRSRREPSRASEPPPRGGRARTAP